LRSRSRTRVRVDYTCVLKRERRRIPPDSKSEVDVSRGSDVHVSQILLGDTMLHGEDYAPRAGRGARFHGAGDDHPWAGVFPSLRRPRKHPHVVYSASNLCRKQFLLRVHDPMSLLRRSGLPLGASPTTAWPIPPRLFGCAFILSVSMPAVAQLCIQSVPPGQKVGSRYDPLT